MKTFEINQPVTAAALNESLHKQFNVRINFDKYTRAQLEDYRNILRTKVHQLEGEANFNDLLTNENYQRDKFVLGVLNTKIKEMLGEAKLAVNSHSDEVSESMHDNFMFTTEIEDPMNPGDHIEVGVNYTYTPEERERGPSYSSGGEPGVPAGFEDLEVVDLATGHDITDRIDPRSLENEIMHDAHERAEYERDSVADHEYERRREQDYNEGKTNMNNRISETKKKAKPDFLDLDKDGNKREPMKGAAKSAKKVKEAQVNELGRGTVASYAKQRTSQMANDAAASGYASGRRAQAGSNAERDAIPAPKGMKQPFTKMDAVNTAFDKLSGTARVPAKEGKNAKPDYIDLDKDGNKREPMKKAAKDAKKKKVSEAKMSAAERAHHHAVEYERHHKQGNLEMALHHRDACDECGGMIQHGPMGECWHMHSGKNGGTPYRVSDDTAHNMIMTQESRKFFRLRRTAIAESIATYIAEDEEGKAKAITAGSDMVNDFTTWMQRVGNYQTKSMIELADNIRANFGVQEAERFKGTVGQALESALQSLTATREEINNAVAVLAGEAPAEEQMGQEPMLGNENPMQPGDEYTDQGADDEFAASDAAAGGIETAGRMKRESIERGNRLMRILGS